MRAAQRARNEACHARGTRDRHRRRRGVEWRESTSKEARDERMGHSEQAHDGGLRVTGKTDEPTTWLAREKHRVAGPTRDRIDDRLEASRLDRGV